MLSVILITVGVLLICFSFWLFLNCSDERVQRHYRSWWTAGMTREGAESARAASAAVLALAFMVFGGVFLFVGVAGLFGLIEG